jgi:hypothetical protein
MQPQHEPGGSAVERSRAAVGEVAGTAKGQAQEVVREAGTQARQVAEQARQRVADEARNQTGRASGSLRQWSDELAGMAESSKPDSPVREAVHQIADGGRRAADYLDRRGFEGAVGELQDFARRRPGTFLLGAVAAGFLVGRAAKASAQASSPSPDRDLISRPEPGYQDDPQAAPEPTFSGEPAYRPEGVAGQEPPFGRQPVPGGQPPYGAEAPVPGQSPQADVAFPPDPLSPGR